jgi:glutamine amidotransferase
MEVDAVVSSKPEDVINSQKIILPGVGHFGKAMSNLKKLNLCNALKEAVLIKQKPILGICLGMQLMAKTSEEGEAEGFGWFDAKVKRFDVSDGIKYKIPHMGWNQVKIAKSSPLMAGITDLSEFYFSHSYYLESFDRSDTLSETQYEAVFVSGVARLNIFGVQYHPEKSHDAGARLLRNFVEL